MLDAFQYYIQAHRLLWKKELRVFLWIPAIINVVLMAALIWLSFGVSEVVVDFFESLFFEEEETGGWFKNAIVWILAFLVRFLLFTLYFLVYKSLILILMSPFLSLLVDRVHQQRTGNNSPWNWVQIWKDTIRGIKIAIRNIIIQLLLMALISMLGFIPVVGMVSPFFLLLLEFYFYGFSMMDYTNEVHHIGVNDSIARIRKHKWKAVGNGMLFYLMLMIPFIGWLFAPSYGAVAAYLQLEEAP